MITLVTTKAEIEIFVQMTLETKFIIIVSLSYKFKTTLQVFDTKLI